MMTRVTTNTNRRPWIVLVASLAIAWLLVPDASAHAAYESSSPAFAEVVSDAPAEIRITFTQELFRRVGANTIALTHTDRRTEIRLGEPEIDNEDRHVMTISVEESLPPGRYVVSWTNLSAEDGDSDSGSYPFYVSRGPSPAQVEADRQHAAELLITYPEDRTESAGDEAQTAPQGPTVVRAETTDRASLGVGPLIWLAVGALAALVVVGALGYHLGRRRQVG